MKKIKASAPGKIHLLGEHAVVYGKPSLLAAVDKRCTITITQNQENIITVESIRYNKRIKVTAKDIIEKTKNAAQLWETFMKTNDKALLKKISTDSLDYVLICIGETALYFQSDLPSFTLTIDSEIPSGMGSSAALAVSIAAAVSQLLGKHFEKKTINEIAFICEQRKHGIASGGDNSTSCYGGFIWYRKETPEVKIIQSLQISLPEKIANSFYYVDTGKPHESTGEMVSLVKELSARRPKYVQKIFDSQEGLVKELVHAISTNDIEKIKEILRNGENNMEKLGVVSGYVKKILRRIEKSGGYAKIAGGGGVTKNTGILLIYHNHIKQLENILLEYKLSYNKIVFGSEGVNIHAN